MKLSPLLVRPGRPRLAAVVLAALAMVVSSSPAQAQWTVTILNPTAPSVSFGYAAHGTQQGGTNSSIGGGPVHACLWNGTAVSFLDLNPSWVTNSNLLGMSDTQQGGYASVNGLNIAIVWSGTAASAVNLNPPGATDSQVLGVGGRQQVGEVGGHAALWTGTAASWVDLSPAGGMALATNGVQQGGWAYANGRESAALWSGAAASWVDLGAGLLGNSKVYGMSETMQAGKAVAGGHDHASVWSGTAASWVDLNPPTGHYSYAVAASGTLQAGWVESDEIGTVASLWNRTAASWVNLQALLPAGTFQYSKANAVWTDGVTIRVVGGGLDLLTRRSEAILWTLHICPGDFNLSGSLNTQDIFDFLNAWFATDPRADVNGAGGIGADDIFDFLNAWFAGC